MSHLIRCLLVGMLATTFCGCKGKTPAATSAIAGGTGASGVTRSVIAGKIMLASADIGKPETLVAWLFGPLNDPANPVKGIASTVDASGNYSFPATLIAGTYAVQVGHTWASPHTVTKVGQPDGRQLDYPLKLNASGKGLNAPLADDTLSLTVDPKNDTGLPTLNITAEPFTTTWDTSSFKPKDGQTLPPQVKVEFNIVGHPAAHDMALSVHAGSNGSGAEVYATPVFGGRVEWQNASPGTYSYQVTCVLVSTKTTTSPWFTFTVSPPK